MKYIPLLKVLFLLLCFSKVNSQPVQDLITRVKKAQKEAQSIAYTLHRTDTLVTGDTRIMTGKVEMLFSRKDTLFGFHFWAQRDGFDQFTLYDGAEAYVVDTETKSYQSIPKPSEAIFYGTTGGQMIVPDMASLDTSNVIDFHLSQDPRFYYLTMIYNDLVAYNVTNRYKEVVIDKTLLMPIVIRKHQETLGQVQDLTFEIKDLIINQPGSHHHINKLNFKHLYTSKTPSIIQNEQKPENVLLNKPAPPLAITTFTGKEVDTSIFAGKVTLLDFWEVWCGPCIESMPKIQELYNLYRDSGLQVFGISHEIKSLSSAKRLIAQKGFTFPNLIGTEKTKSEYKVHAIPYYLILDKKGIIRHTQEGYSPEIKDLILKMLEE